MSSMTWLTCVLVAASACGGKSAAMIDAGPADASTSSDAGPDAPASQVIIVSAPEARAASAAYRDGDGPWMPADLTSGTFAFPVTSDRYSVAIGCTHTTPPRVDVYELTTADATHLEHTVTCSDTRANVSGAVFQASALTRVSFGDDGPQSNTSTINPSYAFQPPAGTHDLIAVRFTGNGDEPDRAIVMRGVTAPADATTNADVDFASTGVVALEQHMLVISPQSNFNALLVTDLVTAGGTLALLSALPAPEVHAVPSSALAPGDLHLVTVHSGGTPGSPGPYEELHRTVRIISDGTLTLPTWSGVPATLTGATPGIDEQFTATWPSHPAGTLYVLAATPESGTNTVFTIEASDAFAGSAFAMQTPDFGDLSGWPASLHMQPALRIDWSIDARQGASLGQLLRPVATVETDVSVVGWAGQLEQ